MNSSQRLAVVRYAAAYDAMSTSLTIAQENAIQLQRATKILEGVRDAMQSPRVSTAHKKLVLQETLKDVPVALSFILVLLDAKRYGLLPAICEQVQTLLDDRKGISRAIVSSAQVLSQAQQTATQKALSARYGKQVEAVFHTDKDLIGGLKILCNGELLDGSIKQQLANLQEKIKQS